MALNVANWSDKQLDELVDMLKSADFSAVSTFIANNFLCAGSRILTDDTASTLKVTLGTDTKTVVLSAGVFVHGGKCSQIDSDQVINILAGGTGSWGTGTAAHASLARYDAICVKNNEQAHTPGDRWFVNDSTVPNTYYTQSTNTLLNKAYYDIVVVSGTPVANPIVPDAPSGYWTIAEVKVPANAVAILSSDIFDTRGVSKKVPANWTTTTRVLRMEFWSTKFGVDHDPATGWHRDGAWHIGSTVVTTHAGEINQALRGIGGTVLAANLTKLTNGSTLALGVLHSHSVAPVTPAPSPLKTEWFWYNAGTLLSPISWIRIAGILLVNNAGTISMPVSVVFTCRQGFTLGPQLHAFSIRRNGAAISESGDIDAFNDMPAMTCADTILPGATYEYDVWWYAASTTVCVLNRSLTVRAVW